MDFSAIKAADDRDRDGVWVGDLPGLGDVRLLVRPLGSPRVLRELGRQERRAGDDDRTDGRLTDDAAARIDREILSGAVLLGWENLTEDGEPVPFSRETALEFMAAELFESAVRVAAIKAGAKAAAKTEALEKN